MAINFTPTATPTLDLSGTIYETGQTTEFVTRANQRNTDTEAWATSTGSTIDANFTGLKAAIDTSLTDVENDIASNVRTPLLNQLPFNGRFLDFNGGLTDADDWWNVQDNTANFRADQLSNANTKLIGLNGFTLDAPVEIGRWINNSATHGGGQAALSADINSIGQAMAAINGELDYGFRYRDMPGFAIARYTQGAGTALTSIERDSTNYYSTISMTAFARFQSAQARVTFACWVRPIGDALYVNGYNWSPQRQLYLDGTLSVSGAWIKLEVGTVYHLCHVANFENSNPDFHFSTWEWLMANNAQLDVWLPCAFPCSVQIKPHLMPFRSLNPLNQ